jgi:hypothetical protein
LLSSTRSTSKVGLLITHTDNIGDEIQSLAVRRFLPQVDQYVDRDKINGVFPPNSQRVLAVLNGWWCHSPENWPPSAAIAPLLVSVHISPFRSPALGLIPSEVFLAEPAVQYLKHYGPVGARDLGTLEMLQKAGVDSYFSGCMTLTIERPDVKIDNDLVVLNDVPDAVAKFMAERTRKRIVTTRHAGFGHRTLEERFTQAQALLTLYAQASCVVTTRLHCAMPCVAMDTPVLLLDTAEDRKRFAGLIDFVNHMTVDEYGSDAVRYQLDRPPPNPGKHLVIRNRLIETVGDFFQTSIEPKPYPFDRADLVKIQESTNQMVGAFISFLRDKIKKV